jgi:hypothetical protein
MEGFDGETQQGVLRAQQVIAFILDRYEQKVCEISVLRYAKAVAYLPVTRCLIKIAIAFYCHGTQVNQLVDDGKHTSPVP